jgi:hypothetical protein
MLRVTLSIYCLFNDTVSGSHYIKLYERINELERMWKEAVVIEFQVQSHHLSGGTEDTHEKLPP